MANLPNQQTICSVTARNLQQAIPTILAIIGPHQPLRAKIFKELDIPVSVCKQATQGMATTLSYGIQCSAESHGWIIALADMPYVQPRTAQKVYQALQTGASIVAPFYQNKRGHPVGFSKKFKQELIALAGDKGAQSIIKKHQTELVRLDTNDSGILADIDIIADLDYS